MKARCNSDRIKMYFLMDPIWAGTKDVKPIAMDRDHARPIQAEWAHVRALTYILICECGLIELTRAPS